MAFQLTTSNMMCYNFNNGLTKYKPPEEIIEEFYNEILKLYITKARQLYIEMVNIGIELSIEQMGRYGLDMAFQLTTPLATSNMMCYNSNNELAKYKSPEKIIEEFMSQERYVIYQWINELDELEAVWNEFININEGNVDYDNIAMESLADLTKSLEIEHAHTWKLFFDNLK
ncbi:11571_t:CDS:2 [Entrophospora sp. SA101]|nr:11571_t:CDS:2 [Entrophospora sp. SA101]